MASVFIWVDYGMAKASEALYELDRDEYKDDRSFLKYFLSGAGDYFGAFKRWRLLVYLANAEMTKTYKRTIIGPFWATLSMGIFIGSMGILFSLLWHTDIKTYLPFFSSGYIVWMLFSGIVTGSCATFTSMEGYIKQIDLPYSFYAFMLICRNLIVFVHQLSIFVVVALVFKVPFTVDTFMVVPALLLLILNCSWITILLGVICTRFRDMQQIVISLLQIAMFITPIFWSESQLSHSKMSFFCIQLNPIYHVISIVRYPLMGEATPLSGWLINIAILLVGWMITMYVLGRKYSKLVYWL